MSAVDREVQAILNRNDRSDAERLLYYIAAQEFANDFPAFCKAAWIQVAPQRLVWNWHLSALSTHLVAVTNGDIRFLAVSLPPRHTKSIMCSVLWPVWHWIHHPQTQFMTASVDDRLALDFSRLSRRLIEGPWFKRLFGDRFYLLPDENAGRQYRTDKGGNRIAASVQGRVIGAGSDIQVLDDPNSVKQIESDTTRQATLNWHDNEWRSRLNNPLTAQKVYVAQRTHDSDVIGHVLAQEGKRWVHLCLPLEFDPSRACITYPNKGKGVEPGAAPLFKDPRKVEGEMLDPKRFDAETAKHEKGIMSSRAWNAQYQQQPEGQGGLILKRGWWRPWVWPESHPQAGQEKPMPEFFEMIQVYDTAFEEDEEADFSARTTWGVFNYEDIIRDSNGKIIQRLQRICAMLLDCMEERLSYPDLYDEAIRSFQDFAPDWILVEKKASGHSLIQSLRRKKLPVKAVGLAGSGGGRSRRQGDLIARAHEASLLLEKGAIWYCPRSFSYKVIDQAAKFPNGDHDDITSTITLAWQYLRKYYDLTVDDEPADEINPFAWSRRPRKYA